MKRVKLVGVDVHSCLCNRERGCICGLDLERDYQERAASDGLVREHYANFELYERGNPDAAA